MSDYKTLRLCNVKLVCKGKIVHPSTIHMKNSPICGKAAYWPGFRQLGVVFTLKGKPFSVPCSGSMPNLGRKNCIQMQSVDWTL